MEKAYGSSTGIYSGSMTDDYKSIITKDVDDMPKYTATGVSMNMVANRLSWFFNFTGPSVNLDSACSSSLMALDIACQGLRNGDASMVSPRELRRANLLHANLVTRHSWLVAA